MYSNDKILLSGSNVSLDLSPGAINLRASSYLFEHRMGLFSYTRIHPDQKILTVVFATVLIFVWDVRIRTVN